MSDCIFCKIIAGEIPSYKVAETPDAYAFLDIAPFSRGHVLVVPKKHYADIFSAPAEELVGVLQLVSKLSQELRAKLPCDGVNILINNGEAAGQAVPHLHWHIIPRYCNDEVRFPFKENSLTPDLAQEILGKLK